MLGSANGAIRGTAEIARGVRSANGAIREE